MDDVDNATWRKSSYSGNNGGDCVEAANAAPVVMVRDTKDRGGLVLSVPAGAWQGFTATIKQPDTARQTGTPWCAAGRREFLGV